MRISVSLSVCDGPKEIVQCHQSFTNPNLDIMKIANELSSTVYTALNKAEAIIEETIEKQRAIEKQKQAKLVAEITQP